MKQEQDSKKPDQGETDSPYPTLEKLFSTNNAARIVILESAGNGYRDPRMSIDSLADKYSGVFGKTGVPRKRKSHDLTLDNLLEGYEAELSDHAKTGDSYIMETVRKREANFMAKVLLSPSKNPKQIKQRQELIGRLASSDKLDDLIDLKDRTWQVFEGLWNFRQILGNYRWEDTSLIEHYYAGTEFVPILANEYERDSEVLEKENVMEIVEEAVDRINRGLAGFTKLGKAFAALKDPFIRQAFSGIPADIARLQQEMTELIPFDKKPAEKDKHYPPAKLDKLKELFKSVEPYFFSFSAVMEFAKKIRDEVWQPVSFDASKPYGYIGGWNLEESKYSQIHNDGPVDAPIIILSGANTSGKSFTMKSDFLVRVAAQSLGFAPVSSGNLPHFDNFIFLDRAATDPQNDLSAFMREIENWKLALQGVNSKTRLYVDEGYSTTSPADQASLLLATAGYVEERGGSVMLATHNDLLLDIAEQNPHMRVYNLQTEVGASGELVRHFKLQPGRSESLSYAVARARQFPQTALAAVSEYLQRGRIEPSVFSGIDYPKLAAKTPEQREQEKQIASTLAQLFPNEPRIPLFQLFSLDHEMKPHGLLWHVARNMREETGGMHDPGELRTLIGQMILWQPSHGPEEALERQKMFDELIKDGIHAKLPAMVGKIGFLEETVALVSKYANEGVNKGLNPVRFSNDEIAKIVKDIEYHIGPTKLDELIKAIDAYLSIQVKLFGDLPAVSDLRNRYKILGEVNNDLIQRWQSWGENPLTDKEQEKVKTIIGGSEEPEKKLTAKDLQIAAVQMAASLQEITNQLPAINTKDLPLADITEELEILETYHRDGEKKEERRNNRSGMMRKITEILDLKQGGLPMAISKLPVMMDNARSLVQTLKSTDSVYLHQAANLIEGQLVKHEAILAGEAEAAVEEEIQSTIPGDAVSPFNHLSRSSGSLFFGRREAKATPFKAALEQVEALAMFAEIIGKQGFAKVRFNDTGEVHLKKAFSLFKDKSEEVANDIDFSPHTTRVQLLTGPNGSGKTFYEKGAVAGMLMALATGYAPAEEATIPVFDTVAYLDMVVEKQDSNYSAFSQELEYWKELLGVLSSRKAAFVAVDEAFSTTSPGYQAAFTSAVVAEVLNRPHFLMLSTHNHDAVSSLTSDGIPLIKPSHFVFDVEDHQIKYHYRLQKGHQTSHAVEVARAMGLPDEITKSASF